MPNTNRNHHVTSAEKQSAYQASLKAKGGKVLSMIMKPEDIEMLKLVQMDLNVGTQAEAIRGALKEYIEKKQLG